MFRLQQLQMLLQLPHVLLLLAHLLKQVVPFLLQLRVLVRRFATTVRQLLAPILERSGPLALRIVTLQQILDLLILLVAGRLNARQPDRNLVQFLLLLLQQIALVVEPLQQLRSLTVDRPDAVLLLVDPSLQLIELLLVLLPHRRQLTVVLLRSLLQPFLQHGTLFAACLQLPGSADERIDPLLYLDAPSVYASQTVHIECGRNGGRVRSVAVLRPQATLQCHYGPLEVVQYRRHLLHFRLVERMLAGKVLVHEVEICLGQNVVRVRHLEVGRQVGVQVLVLLQRGHTEHALLRGATALQQLLLAARRYVVTLEHLHSRIDQCLVRDNVRELAQQLPAFTRFAFLLEM
uniref:Putative secreted protein n=1 Tax=Anopheles triannulatus TaxID=58253 RepID=A0A2M4B2N6_9DIPT